MGCCSQFFSKQIDLSLDDIGHLLHGCARFEHRLGVQNVSGLMQHNWPPLLQRLSTLHITLWHHLRRISLMCLDFSPFHYCPSLSTSMTIFPLVLPPFSFWKAFATSPNSNLLSSSITDLTFPSTIHPPSISNSSCLIGPSE